MSINSVTARIDVMVNGQANLDRLANSYRSLESMSTRASSAVKNWGNQHTTTSRSLTGVLGALNNYSRNMAAHTNAVQSADRATASWGGSVLKLTRSMVLFSVLLPLVKLPETAIRSFQQFIEVGSQWETQVRSVASLMGMQNDQINTLDKSLQGLKATYALTNEEVGQTIRQVATTLDVVQRNQTGMTAAQRAQDDYNTTLAMTNDIAKLSRAAYSDMSDTQNAFFTIMSTGQLTVNQMDDAMEMLFKTVQVGRTNFAQFNSAAQRFLPFWEDWIQATGNADDAMKRLTGTLDLFEAASLQLGPQRAATGVGQIAQAITKQTSQQQDIVQQMEVMRRRGNLGDQFDIRPQTLYAMNDMQQVVQQLNNALGEGSPLVDQYIKRYENLAKARHESLSTEQIQTARAEYAKFLQQQYLGSKTAVAAFTAASEPGQMALVTQQRQEAGGVEPAYEIYQQDPTKAADRMRSAWENVQTNVFTAMQKQFVDLNLGVARVFENISKQITGGAGGENVFQRLEYIGSEIVRAFTQWFNTGGKRDIANFGTDLARFMMDAITGFFKGQDGQNAIADAGSTFATSFAAVVGQKLPGLLAAALQSAVGQAIATYMLYKMAGAPGPAAAVMAAGATAGMQSGNPLGMAAGAGVAGFGILTAGRVLLNRPLRSTMQGGQRVPVPGSSISEMVGNRVGQIGPWATHRNVTASMAGADYASGAELRAAGINRVGPNRQFVGPSQLYYVGPGGIAAHAATGGRNINRALPRGDPMEAEVLASRNLRQQAQSPGGRRMQIGAGIGSAALLGGLGAFTALQAPAGQRSEAMTSAVLGTLGMIGGGVLGGLATGGLGGEFIGGAAGQALGSWAGGQLGQKISPWLEPILSGGQTGSADSQIAASDTLAQGIDQSQMAINIDQMNRKVQSGTGMGGLSVGTTIGRATTGGTVGTGGGPLSNNFVNQYDPSSPLTKSQADAACGPAAASFFAAAYGRQPTLAEAYAMQSQLQGGDIANLGGSNIGALATNINKNVGSNVATAHTGVDWGQLAENAKAGIPGIINIGPNKSTGFPGHFLQVAGYNPANNTFNVGASGKALRGGSDWMTPAQMTAYGPGIGWIGGTGQGLVGGTGGGDLHAMARNAAIAAGIDPNIFERQIQQESNFNINAKSKVGALGIAQIMPNVASAAGVNPLDPSASLTYAANRDATALAKYGGDWKSVLAEYNAGPGNLQKYGLSGVMSKDFAQGQTLNYINQILGASANGTGTGMGGGPMGGAGININGPLIGQVIIGAGATEDQANELASILADILDESHLTAGSSIGQVRLLTP